MPGGPERQVGKTGMYVYNSYNESIEFSRKAPDGALFIYTLGCEAAWGKEGSVA